MNSKEEKWINTGYKKFAKDGPKGLKIETLAKSVNSSRSSFYHYFADVEIFTSKLLEHHIKRSELMCKAALECKNLDPDLMDAIVYYKTDILFNRQLRVNNQNPLFKSCILKSHKPLENAFLDIWTKELNLDSNPAMAKMLLKIVVDNFYMRISEENLNYNWLKQYLLEIMEMTKEFDT